MYSWYLLLKSRDAGGPEADSIIASGGPDPTDLQRPQRSLLFLLGCVEFAPLPAAYVIQQWIPSAYGTLCWIGGVHMSMAAILLLRKRVPDKRVEVALPSDKERGDQ